MAADPIPTPVTGNPVPEDLRGGNARPDAISNEASDSSGSGASQQQAGTAAVSNDDAGPISASRPSTPVDDENVVPSRAQSCSPVQHEHLTQVLAGYALLTPEQQKEVSRIISPHAVVTEAPAALTSPAKSGRSGPLFSDDAERPALSSTGDHKFGIHPEIIRLAECRLHLPLTLFLAQSQKDLFLKPNLLREHLIIKGSKTYVIRVDQFPDEERMDPTDWMEAWANYLVFLEAEASERVFLRWQKHFKFLSSQQDLRRNFPAILRFDIERRREYTAFPTVHDEEVYLRRFQEVKHMVLFEELDSWKKLVESSGKAASSAPSSRFTPYSSTSDASLQPFPKGSGTKTGGPICLICARPGHRFSDCKETHNERGEAVACRFSGKKLVSISTVPRRSAGSFTFAPSVGSDHISPALATAFKAVLPSLPSVRLPSLSWAAECIALRSRVVTPYSPDAFQAFLDRFPALRGKYPFLVHKLTHGFRIGNMEVPSASFTPPNHPSADRYHSQVLDYLKSEVAKGRMSGPFTKRELEQIVGGPFRSSPIQVVAKHDSDGNLLKTRMAVNLSFKDGSGLSVNDMIDAEDFPTKWGTAAEVEQIVAFAPPGTEAATLDVEAAFRTVPVHPSHKRFIVVSFDGLFWLDHMHPFGLVSSGGNHGEVADFTVDCWEEMGVGPSKKWVDDFCNFRSPIGGTGSPEDPFRYCYDRASMLEMVAPLGVPWHTSKGQDFAPTFDYLGFHWDISSKSVSLSDEKRLKFKGRPTSWCVVTIKVSLVLGGVAVVLIGSSTWLFVGPSSWHTSTTSLSPFPSLLLRTIWPTQSLAVFWARQPLNCLRPLISPWSFNPSFAMSDTPLARALAGVDVAAEAGRLRSRLGSESRALEPQVSARRIKKPRRPRPGNSYTPSALRPHVLASDRLIAWTTPCTLSFRQSLNSLLPSADAYALLQVMLFSLDEDTRSVYGAGPLRFTQYCDSRNIPEEDRMPASEVLLAGFATAMAAGKVASTTLDNWLAGLHFWHTINGAPWHGHDMLRTVKNGVAKLVPDTSRRAKRPPVTIQHLYALRRGLDLSSSFDAAVWALACIAFWSCCELLIPSRHVFDPSKHVARGCPMSFRSDAGGISSAVFHIPWSKTTRNLGADIVVTKINDPSDPFIALQHHLSTNKDVPAEAPLFSFVTAGGGHAPMTRDWFLQRCEDVWEAAGLPRMAGHAFRIGGATELLLRGTPPDIVAVQGRWRSRAFLDYWRRIEGILPLFITNSFASSRAALVIDTMADYTRLHGRRRGAV
ncbi:hypothetical protein CVT26_005787 [Gymnopilus dilepis]|uniref:Uncharacterized protein n=1 Tax=Gymnopilus dilepis TaxID=231916 RepID=A0A409YL71_9AGAR|nr:hypothetical protein CVT26_005787 [Gymnopilus dilepis]